MLTRFLAVMVLGLTLSARAADDSSDAGQVAETFFNSYVKAQPEFHNGYESVIAWVKASPLVTEAYKKAIAKLYRDALRQDPEGGYGSDAVIGGQDSPDHFKAKKCKVTGDTAEVMLFGDDPFPMKVRVFLVRTGGKWLIDKSGALLPGDGPGQ